MHKPIQIVDEEGNHLGVASHPREAMEKAQIRLISRVIIANDEGKVLLQKRAPNMHAWPGCWDSSAAGHVDEGETPETAAYRELQEEIGLEVPLRLERRFYNENKYKSLRNRTYNYIYKGAFNGEISGLTLQEEEVSEVKWFSVEEIIKMIREKPELVSDGLRLIFESETYDGN